MSHRFQNKVVVVTGAARGIGRVVAQAFAEEGATVVVADRDRLAGKKCVEALIREGGNADFISVNLAATGAAQAMLRRVAKKWGQIDVLVNNARSGQRTDAFSETEKTWAESLSVTLTAAFFASQEAIRLMSRRKKGRIINIGSVAGFLACPESPAYHAAKAGLLHVTRQLAVAAGPLGIRVNAVSPGFIVQDEHRARFEHADNKSYRDIAFYSHPLRKIGYSRDVANAVLFLSSDDADFISGENLVIDGAMSHQEQSDLLRKFSQRRGK